MKAVSLIGAIALGVMAIWSIGVSAIVCAILSAGLFVSTAVYSLRPAPVREGERTDHLNKRGWLGLPDWVA